MIELSVADRLDDERRAAVRVLVAAAAAEDGSAALSEQSLLNLSHPGAALLHLLATDPDAAPGTDPATDPTVDPTADPVTELAAGPAVALAGYAQLDRSDPDVGPVGEFVVHPAHRRRGLGGQLVEALVERTGGPLRLWAHGDHPGAARLAERCGFVRDRVLWQLRRDLDDALPDPVLPDGVRLRPFTVGQDEAEFLRVNNAAFAWHPEQGGWDVARLEQREAEPWFDPDGFLLAVDDAPGGRLLGFHWTKVHSGADPIGEVYVLGVDPAARGRRLGRALTLAGLHHLRGRGLSRVMLYVEADNEAAVRVYRDLGFTEWHADVVYRRC